MLRCLKLRMTDEEQAEEPATRRARLRAARRRRKREPPRMAVSGKSVFLLKRIIDERARAARRTKRRG
jgi:hypothetical protein